MTDTSTTQSAFMDNLRAILAALGPAQAPPQGPGFGESFLDNLKSIAAIPAQPRPSSTAIRQNFSGNLAGIASALGVDPAVTSQLFPRPAGPAKPAETNVPGGPIVPANVVPAGPPGRAPIQPDAKAMELPLGFDPTVSPVTLPAPPQMGLPGGVNTSGIKKFLEEARPQSSENLAAVLGGLARGAGSVDATKPGSFAAALAAAGAGGMEGFRESAKDTRSYLERRAAGELEMQKIAAQHSLQKTQIEYNNAHAMYETNVKNLLAVQEAQMKNREMQMPKVQHDANGITISRVNPQTQTVNVDFTPTKTILDKADNLVNYNKALGMPGPAAEAQAVQWIQSSAKDPLVANELMRREAATRTIQNGAGQAVFGDAYTAASKKAQAILQQENPTLVTKPDEYQLELNKRIAAVLLADPKFNHPGWLQRAAQQRIIPAMIMQGIPVTEAFGGGQQ